MPLRTLTDLAVTNAKPKAQGYEISDGGQRGLRLSVRPSGSKSYLVRYRSPVTGKSAKLTLPGGISLRQARLMAAQTMDAVAQGRDPIQDKKAEKVAAAVADENTLAAVSTRWLELVAAKFRSKRHYELVLKNNILPRLGSTQVTALTRSQIVDAFDHVEEDAGPRAADMALAVLGQILRWYEARKDNFRSPIIASMAKRSDAKPRDRILSDDEIKSVWKACGDERMGMFGQAIRLMLLTGARRSEVAGIRRSEIEDMEDNGAEFRVWRLPARRSKNGEEVIRPLSRAVLGIVDAQPALGDGDLVFSLNGISPMSLRFTRKEHLLDRMSGTERWTLHDLRRTFRSMLSRLRVPFETAERLLGHSQDILSKTYDRHSHLPAMQEAVDKIAAEVERIVAGKVTGKVIRPSQFAG
jgi:integrase